MMSLTPFVQEPVLECLLPELDYEDIKQIVTINTRLNNTILLSKILSKILETKGLEFLLKWLQQHRNYKDLTLTSLSSLQELRLHNNNFEKIPPEICQLSSLKNLWLYNNRLEKIPEIGLLSNLRELRLSNNNLKEIPKTLLARTNLYIDDRELLYQNQNMGVYS